MKPKKNNLKQKTMNNLEEQPIRTIMEIEQPTNQYESKDLSIILWIVLMLVFSLGIILEGYEDKPETRKIYHLNEFRGHLINMAPVNINEHCKE